MKATLIPMERFEELKEAVKKENQKTGTIFSIRKAGTSQTLFNT